VNRRFIKPMRDIGSALFEVQKPARYVGGESGAAPSIEQEDTRLRIALCFPDLYEIGMSNNALRIIYSWLNEKKDHIVCERVFAPAPDFERLLIQKRYRSIHWRAVFPYLIMRYSHLPSGMSFLPAICSPSWSEAVYRIKRQSEAKRIRS